MQLPSCMMLVVPWQAGADYVGYHVIGFYYWKYWYTCSFFAQSMPTEFIEVLAIGTTQNSLHHVIYWLSMASMLVADWLGLDARGHYSRHQESCARLQLVIALHAPGRLYYYEVQRRYSFARVYVCSLEYKVVSSIGSYLFIALVPQTLPSKQSMLPFDHVQS